MGTESLSCPNCGAGLHVRPIDEMVACTYCDSTVQIKRGGSGESIRAMLSSQVRSPTPAVEEEIKHYLREGQRIEAIKLYREHTGEGLKESKAAVYAIGESIGIEFSGKEGSGCIIAAVGFMLWIGITGLAYVGVGSGLRRMFGKSLSAGLIETTQVLSVIFLLIVPIVGRAAWLNLRSRRKQRSP